MLRNLRVKIVDIYETNTNFCLNLDFNESRLSRIIHEHVTPTPEERAKIVSAFGARVLRPSPTRASGKTREAANG